MDAITLLKGDHKMVNGLFRQFQQAHRREASGKQKAAIVKKIITELSAHVAIEEQVFYPAVRAEAADLEDDILESYEEHHVVKWTLAELAQMDPANERYDAKVIVLTEHVRHHVKEEEESWFPKVRESMGRKRLSELGDKLVEAKKAVPRKPRPQSA